MSETWVVVLGVGAVTVACKAAGPVLLGGRRLRPRTLRVVGLLAPVLLTALVVTQAVGGDEEVVLDARLPGVAVGGLALWRGLPLVPAMMLAAAVTALARLVA